MKKAKKIIAAIISVMVLLVALPMSASAAATISSAEIELNITQSTDADNWDSYIKINTNGLKLDDVYVYDYYGDYTASFEIGVEYEFYLYFVPEEGYEFPDSTFELAEVTINGEEAEFYLYSTGEDEDEYDLLEVCYSTTIGGEINEIALGLDVYGEFSTDNYYSYVKFLSPGVDFMFSTKDVVLVYDEDGNLATGKFVAGKDYTFKIFLSPKNNCNFSKNDEDEFELESVTVNGKDAAYSVSSYETNDYYEYIVIEATVTAEKANILKDINIDISNDLADVYVEDWESYVTINTEGLEFDDDNGDPAVFAYDMFDFRVEQYLPGETYYLYIYFTPEEGYVFPEYYEFDSVTVNGIDYREVNDFGIYTGEDGKDICFIGIEFVAEVEADYGFNFFAMFINFFQSIIDWIMSIFTFVTI